MLSNLSCVKCKVTDPGKCSLLLFGCRLVGNRRKKRLYGLLLRCLARPLPFVDVIPRGHVFTSFRYLLRRLIRRYHFIGVEYQPTLRLSLRSALGTAWVAFHTGLSYTPAARSTRLRARVKPSMVLMLGLRNLIVGYS